MAEKTIGELQDEQKKGPVSGYSTGQIPGVGIYQPNTGQQVSTTGQSVAYVPPKATDQSARIGDYVMQGGTAVVVPNSLTDLNQRYLTVTGGSPRPTVGLSDIAGGAAAGASTGVAVGSIGGPYGQGLGAVLGGIAGALNAFDEKQKQALEAWRGQKVNVESAVDFYRDEEGKLRAKIDYEQAEKGGVLSGQGVKDVQNIQTTVDLGDDGRLKVNTSPGFAATNLYKNLLGDISTRYAGLTKDDAEYEKKISEIRDLIGGWADRYRYELSAYADYRQRFKDADDQAVMAAYTSELGGYVEPDKMGEYKMATISESGEVTERSAKDLFDSVYEMNKDERNDFIRKLSEIAYGDDEKYTDSDRAIAYGELQALHAADANVRKFEDDKYEGMLDADFAVTLIDNFRPLGLNTGDVVKFVSGGNLMTSSQEYLDQNELAKTIGSVSGPAVGTLSLVGATKGLENVLKTAPGTGRLFKASLQGTTGGALAFLAQNTGNTAKMAKAIAASSAFEVIKDGIFDAALAGTKTLVSGEDFLPTFGEDFARDLVVDVAFQYYDAVKFSKTALDNKVFVYRGEDGRIETLKTDGQSIISESGETLKPVGSVNVTALPSGSTVGVETDAKGSTVMVDGNVVRINKVDEAPAFKDGVVDTSTPGSADEVISNALRKAGLPADTQVFAISAKDAASAEAAAKVASWDTSKVGLTVNKQVFNKNAGLDALNNIAFSKDANRTAWQNTTEIFANNLKLAENMKTDIQNGRWIKSTADTWNNYVLKQGEFQSSFGKMKKTDFYYLNAKEAIERARLAESEKVEGDTRNYEKEALEKYGKYLDLPADRAKALDDFQDARKAYLTDFNRSVRRSGWVDRDKLDAATESSLQTQVGWVPLWGKKEDYRGLLDSFYGISQTRKPIKSWIREGDLVDVEDYENPLIADERYTQMQATNMALNYRNQITAQRAGAAGLLVDNTPSPETVRKKKLASIKNKDELKKKLDDMVADTEKKIEEASLTAAEYADMMSNLYEKYKIDEAIEAAVEKGDFDKLVKKSTWMLKKSNQYLDKLGVSTDVDAYVRTSLRPDLEAAVKNGDKSLIAARITQAQEEVTPFIDPDYLKKSQLDATAERWREWAEKHVKGGRANTKQLKAFAESNMLELPDRKGPLAGKIKHALWEKVRNSQVLPEIEGLDTSAVSPNMDKQAFYKMLDETPLFQSAVRNKKELVDLVSAEINGETTDAYKMGTSKAAAGMGGKFPISYYVNGRPYTRFMTYRNEEEYRLAEEISHELNDKELLVKHGVFSRLVSGVSNTFMNLTTALDPSRVGPNVARDTIRGEVMSGGESFINAGNAFKSVVAMGGYTKSQTDKLNSALDLAVKKAANDTYNSQFKNPKNIQTQLAEEYLDKSGAGPLRKFAYRFAHDKASILAAPADFFESFTRKRLAKSAASVALYRAQKDGKSFKAQMEDMLAATEFAGREYTANFLRKGETIGRISKYVPYLGSAYAGVDSLKRAYINNPKGVTQNFAAFLFAYLVLLADTLSDEESRKQYHRLSEYDRAHSIVISLGDNSILTIPLDEQLASFAYPYRRILETLSGTDPVSFYELVWGTLTEPLPMDLSGFSEGGYFNLQRGLERLVEQNAPRALTSGLEVATGYDLYYGSSNEVTQEYLQNSGLYAPEPGDYTTASKNSATLRAVSNITGIPQWRLQSIVSNFGGNVGQYVLNTIDKLAGASKDAQGGKDFADAVFKSFVATDSDNAASQFYEGIQNLQQDKQQLLQKIYNNNKDAKTATGQALVEIQQKTEKAKQEYATKVADFVRQYLDAYEITGGLSKSQANQVFYLFVLGDNETPYEAGSVAEYYGNEANQQMRNEATRLSASILDKYYDQSKTGVYQDANGDWRVYAPYGQQAYLNTFYGQGTQYEVDLRNILEGKTNSLKGAKTAASARRHAAAEAKNWDEYNKIAADFDKQVINAIAPYIQQQGAENVLTNATALDYLKDWFYVPDSFIRTKKNKYVSLAHDASTQQAFVRPYIKYLFGLDTGATNYHEIELENNKAGEFIK